MHQSARKTVHLDPRIHRALRQKAAKTGQTISAVVSEAVALSLREDRLDPQAFVHRKHESARPLNQVIRDMKHDGLL